MDYWDSVMQDDVFILSQDGWNSAKVLKKLLVIKGEKLKESPDLVINKDKYKAEIIAPSLIVARYFAVEQKKIDAQQAELDSISQELESFIEEHSGDEGLLVDALNDKNKVTAATVKVRLKVSKDAEEIGVLKQLQKLFEQESTLKKAVKDLQDALDLAVFQKYPQLDEQAIKTLVVEYKWLATLKSNIEAEIERATQQLANRVKVLDERYAEPLPQISQNVDGLSDKVAQHLKVMGLEWSL